MQSKNNQFTLNYNKNNKKTLCKSNFQYDGIWGWVYEDI